jgi:hypothetical protein
MWQRLVRRIVSGDARHVFVSDFKNKQWIEVTSKNLTQPSPYGGEEVWWIEQLFRNAANTILIAKINQKPFSRKT